MIQHLLWAANRFRVQGTSAVQLPQYLLKAPKNFNGRHLIVSWRHGSVLQIFILSGLRLENAAAEGPQISLQAQPYQQTNQLLRFGIGVGLLLAIGLGQAGSCMCMTLHKHAAVHSDCCTQGCGWPLALGRQAPACTCSCASGCSAVWLR